MSSNSRNSIDNSEKIDEFTNNSTNVLANVETHLERDLGLAGDEYNWALGIFFLSYVLFEVPSNIALIKFNPSIWSCFNTYGRIGWGIIMTDMVFLFILDGVMKVIIAFFSYFSISDYAETASWLTEDERKLAVDRLRYDGGYAHTTHFDKHQILLAFKDSKIYIFMFLNVCLHVTFIFFFFFRSNHLISQLLSTPPFVLGCISCLVISKLSDHFGVRSLYLIFCLLVSIIGYVILIVPSANIAAKYTAVYIVGLGAFPTIPQHLHGNIPNIVIQYILMMPD
ncbi:MFS general substrate transporter [Gigaspora margarita]|uniref:MFS general substrate transporter n=1 Tax=Gigaspora margarita TaxID=4874 RepID=A0A8H3WUQ0_GIGMA|nr:MFS general substrate transporter [Gigaspora margarita]